MATGITGRNGLLRAEDSTGCAVAIDGHWFDVTDILAEPDAGLVQLHGVSSTGAQEWHHLDTGAVLGQVPGLPVHRFPVMSGHRVTIQTAGTLTGAAATRLCASVAGSPADDSTAA